MLTRFILWFFLLIILGAFLYWHYYERKSQTNEPRFKINSPPKIWLRYFVRSKPLQLTCIIFFYSLFLALLDWNLYKANQTIGTLQISQQQLEKEKESLAESLLTLMEKTQNTSPAPPPTSSKENEPQDVHDVYNPESSLSGIQPKIDALKKRYEEILVTHFFLKKCELAMPTDYHIIISSLSQEMASMNAPGRLQYDIVTAAQGSYQEMYSMISCDDGNMETLQSQYADYISSLSKNLPAS